jgi:hypothetical protein
MINLFDKFAQDLNEMDKFSRQLAIVILSRGVDKDILSKPELLVKRFSKWLKKTNQSLVNIL